MVVVVVIHPTAKLCKQVNRKCPLGTRFYTTTFNPYTDSFISQLEPRDAAVNFDICIEFYNGIACAVSLPQHGFLVGLCRVQTTVNHLSAKKWQKTDDGFQGQGCHVKFRLLCKRSLLFHCVSSENSLKYSLSVIVSVISGVVNIYAN